MSYKVGYGAFDVAVVDAGNEAFGAVIRAGMWCTQYGTGGVFPECIAKSIAPGRVWEKAVEAGLLRLAPDGFEIVGYTDLNPTAEEARARRFADVERAAMTPALRAAVVAAKGLVCGICGLAIEGALHIDHIVPIAKGGRTRFDNLQPAHATCNIRKGAN